MNLINLFALVSNVAGHLPPFLQFEQNKELIKRLHKAHERVKSDINFVAEKDVAINLQVLTESIIEALEEYGKQHLENLMLE